MVHEWVPVEGHVAEHTFLKCMHIYSSLLSRFITHTAMVLILLYHYNMSSLQQFT
jgi:hypothetical protein